MTETVRNLHVSCLPNWRKQGLSSCFTCTKWSQNLQLQSQNHLDETATSCLLPCIVVHQSGRHEAVNKYLNKLGSDFTVQRFILISSILQNSNSLLPPPSPVVSWRGWIASEKRPLTKRVKIPEIGWCRSSVPLASHDGSFAGSPNPRISILFQDMFHGFNDLPRALAL